MGNQYDRQLVPEDYWNMIWRRKWLIVLFVVLATGVTFAVNNLVEPVYEASSTLHLKNQKPSVLEGEILGSGLSSETELRTQLEIMKSRKVLEEVVEKLRLPDAFRIGEDLDREERMRRAFDELEKNLDVASVSGTTIVRISVRSLDAVLARRITEALCDAYIRRTVESRRLEANAVLAFVEDQLDQIVKKVRTSEEELLAYKTSQGIRSLDEESRLKVDQLVQLERLQQDVKVSRDVLKARRSILLAQAQPGVQIADLRNPTIDELKRRLTEQQSRMYTLASFTGSPSSKELEQTKARIGALKTEVQNELSRGPGVATGNLFTSAFQLRMTEYETEDIVLASQEEALQRSINVYKADVGRLPQQQIDLIRLERNRRINDELYSSLTKAKNEAEIEAASQTGNVEIVDPAVAGTDPVWPQKNRNLVMAFHDQPHPRNALAFLLEYHGHHAENRGRASKPSWLIRFIGLIPGLPSTFQVRTGNRSLGSIPGESCHPHRTALPCSGRVQIHPDKSSYAGFRYQNLPGHKCRSGGRKNYGSLEPRGGAVRAGKEGAPGGCRSQTTYDSPYLQSARLTRTYRRPRFPRPVRDRTQACGLAGKPSCPALRFHPGQPF